MKSVPGAVPLWRGRAGQDGVGGLLSGSPGPCGEGSLLAGAVAGCPGEASVPLKFPVGWGRVAPGPWRGRGLHAGSQLSKVP